MATYDKNTNYADAINKAKASGASLATVKKLDASRLAKIAGEKMTGVSTASMVGNYSSPKKAKKAPKMQTFEDYSQPFTKLFDQRVLEKYKPEYMKFTYNPAMNQYNRNMAVSNNWRMGSAPSQTETQIQQLNRGYAEQEANARQTYMDAIRNDYNQRMASVYSSPTYLTDILGGLTF